jgi:hypothetical protein
MQAEQQSTSPYPIILIPKKYLTNLHTCQQGSSTHDRGLTSNIHYTVHRILNSEQFATSPTICSWNYSICIPHQLCQVLLCLANVQKSVGRTNRSSPFSHPDWIEHTTTPQPTAPIYNLIHIPAIIEEKKLTIVCPLICAPLTSKASSTGQGETTKMWISS